MATKRVEYFCSRKHHELASGLPWGDPSFAAQIPVTILFVCGKTLDLISASFNVNPAVHNTMWAPGHSHLTAGSATTLTFFGHLYWLLPELRGRHLWNRKLAPAQARTWFIGMLLASNSLHLGGPVFSAPRSSMLGAAPYLEQLLPNWTLWEAASGRIILGISGLLRYSNVFGTLSFTPWLAEEPEMPVAEPVNPEPAPAWPGNLRSWLIGAVAQIIVA